MALAESLLVSWSDLPRKPGLATKVAAVGESSKASSRHAFSAPTGLAKRSYALNKKSLFRASGPKEILQDPSTLFAQDA